MFKIKLAFDQQNRKNIIKKEHSAFIAAYFNIHMEDENMKKNRGTTNKNYLKIHWVKIINKIQIERAHRVEAKEADKDRTIIAKFSSY